MFAIMLKSTPYVVAALATVSLCVTPAHGIGDSAYFQSVDYSSTGSRYNVKKKNDCSRECRGCCCGGEDQEPCPISGFQIVVLVLLGVCLVIGVGTGVSMYLDGELRCQEQRRLCNAEEAVGGDDVEEHRSRTDPADRGGAPTVRTSVLILESVEDVDVGRGDPPALYVNRKTLPTENLLEDTDGLLRLPF